MHTSQRRLPRSERAHPHEFVPQSRFHPPTHRLHVFFFSIARVSCPSAPLWLAYVSTVTSLHVARHVLHRCSTWFSSRSTLSIRHISHKPKQSYNVVEGEKVHLEFTVVCRVLPPQSPEFSFKSKFLTTPRRESRPRVIIMRSDRPCRRRCRRHQRCHHRHLRSKCAAHVLTNPTTAGRPVANAPALL